MNDEDQRTNHNRPEGAFVDLRSADGELVAQGLVPVTRPRFVMWGRRLFELDGASYVEVLPFVVRHTRTG